MLQFFHWCIITLLYDESNFMSSGDAHILQSRKASQDFVSKNSLQPFKKMKDEPFKGWAWLLFCLLLSYLHFWMDREDPVVVSTGKQVRFGWVFFFNRILTWRIAKPISHSCHSTYTAENWSAALSQGNMCLEIFRNTLNFLKPLGQNVVLLWMEKDSLCG